MEVTEGLTSILNSIADKLSEINSGELYDLGSKLADLLEEQEEILGHPLWESVATLGSLLEESAGSLQAAATMLNLIKGSLKES